MSDSAAQKLESVLGKIPIQIERIKEESAFGNGTAIM